MRTERKTDSDIEIDALNAVTGETTLYVDDNDPAERQELAEQMQEFMRRGVSVFLIQGQEARRIKGYDAETNEWLVSGSPVPAPQKPEETSPRKGRRTSVERVSARGTKATAVPPISGG